MPHSKSHSYSLSSPFSWFRVWNCQSLLPQAAALHVLFLCWSLQQLALTNTWLLSFDTAIASALSLGVLPSHTHHAQGTEVARLGSYSPSADSSSPCLSLHPSASQPWKFMKVTYTPVCTYKLSNCTSWPSYTSWHPFNIYFRCRVLTNLSLWHLTLFLADLNIHINNPSDSATYSP